MRTRFKLTEEPCCDYLLFYKSKDKHAFLIFIGLKEKGGTDKAADQILSAYGALCSEDCEMRKDVKGLIVTPGGAPTNRRGLQKKLGEGGLSLFFARSDKKTKCDLRKVPELMAYFHDNNRKQYR